MRDLKIINACGTTNKRLKEIFTAVPYPDDADVTDEQKEAREEDIKRRKKFEESIRDRQNEGIMFNLSNHKIFSAPDLAWDSRPINPMNYSLMMYAEGRIDVGSCAKELSQLSCADQFIEKDAKGNPVGINMPKFTDVTVNLIPSFITRRLAAQSNKYQNIWPYYKYEPRGTSPVAKLRGDLMSQIGDIMADAYDHRHHEVQVMRDMMLYSTSIDFVRCAWECEKQWERDSVSEEFQLPEGEKPRFKAAIQKEGVCFVNPHPSRVFSDNAYPISSLNTDIGCSFLGYWDVVRYRDVHQNLDYWNTKSVTFDSNLGNLFTNYPQYFSQYYCTIKAPTIDYGGSNDLKSSVGYWAANQMDSAVVLCNYFQKLVPKDYGIGDYPYEVWIRFITAGADGTVINAEILPSSPAAVAQFNCKDDRRLNKSIAHELMGYQDQMTNLQNYLLLCLETDNIKVFVVDEDTASPEALKAFEAQARGEKHSHEPWMLKISGKKLMDLGLDPSKIVQMVETRNSSAIDVIFRAMLHLLMMVERLMALSPQEQGQPAPREISATEVNLIAGTTESVYGFISDSIDEMRAAKKRIIYESYINCGNNDVRLPAIDRYSDDVVKKAGFEVVPEEMEIPNDPSAPQRHTIIGSKRFLVHDYIFTSRDGAERSLNTQSANVLVQLLGILQNPIVMAAIGKEKYFEIVNEAFRTSGAGVDLKLALKDGESDQFGADQNAQMQQVLQQITAQLEKQQQALMQLGQQVGEMQQAGQKLAADVSQDVKDFKVATAAKMKDMDHAQEIEITRLQEQLKQLMRETIKLARNEVQVAA